MADNRFHPITGSVMPRFAGIATLMRLPLVGLDEPMFKEVDIGLVGVPWDGGTTNRAGARHGPRQVRDNSTMVRNVNRASGIKPFSICNCADPLPLLRRLPKVAIGRNAQTRYPSIVEFRVHLAE
jgi:guanidinopropionase